MATYHMLYLGFRNKTKIVTAIPTAKIKKNAPVPSQPSESESAPGTRHGRLMQTAPMINEAIAATDILPSK